MVTKRLDPITSANIIGIMLRRIEGGEQAGQADVSITARVPRNIEGVEDTVVITLPVGTVPWAKVPAEVKAWANVFVPAFNARLKEAL